MPDKKVNITAIVAEATVLARKVKEDSARLNELKEQIRHVAEKTGGPEKVEFPSSEGVCTVVFVGPTTCLKAGADPELLQEEIPEQVWDILFETTVSLTKDFQTKLDALPKISGFTMNARGRKLINEMLEDKSNAPRVILAK